jgi:hypothetical protein
MEFLLILWSIFYHCIALVFFLVCAMIVGLFGICVGLSPFAGLYWLFRRWYYRRTGILLWSLPPSS